MLLRIGCRMLMCHGTLRKPCLLNRWRACPSAWVDVEDLIAVGRSELAHGRQQGVDP